MCVYCCECMRYLAAAPSCSISAGTHLSLHVAGLAVRSWDVTLTLSALWEMWKQAKLNFCYQQYSRQRGVGRVWPCFMLHHTNILLNKNVTIFTLRCEWKHDWSSDQHKRRICSIIFPFDWSKKSQINKHIYLKWPWHFCKQYLLNKFINFSVFSFYSLFMLLMKKLFLKHLFFSTLRLEKYI